MESEYILAGIALLAFAGFLAWRISESRKSKETAPGGSTGTGGSGAGNKYGNNQKLK